MAVKSWPQGFPDVKSSSMVRAKKFQSNLGSEFPSFVKALRRSHVSSCFLMALPTWFCKSHLPKENTTIVLEDENRRCYDIYYLARLPGMSGGWKTFSMEHNFLEGDVLVFHLIRPTKFKVYMVTPHDKAEAEGAVGLPNLDDRPKQANADHGKLGMATCKSKKRKSGKLVSPEAERKNKRTRLHLLQHKDHTRNKYYELCRSQSALLHKHLLKGIDAKLIAAIISETVHVADALRACKLSTPPDELSTWDKTVIAFELLGMDVGFLRVRAERLLNLIIRSEVAKERKRTLEDKIAQVSCESQIRELEAKLIELKEVEAKLTELKEAGRQQRESLEALNMEAESYELDFFDVVNAPW